MKLIIIVLVVCIFIGLVYFQAKLSKNKNRYYGIILPITCIVLSISHSLIGTPNSTEIETTQEVQVVDNDGNILSDIEYSEESIEIKNYASSLFMTLFYSNIITLIFIIIYIYQRLQLNKERQLLIMRANDL